jgi:predicted transcriptional regulator
VFHVEQKEPASQQLGNVLKRFFEAERLTQTDVSVKAGIPRNSLNRKLSGGVFSYDELTCVCAVAKKKGLEVLAAADALMEQGLAA